ncbi:acetyl/propionyl/methylcrotonyl-CoA carboxylase subunit alpha [Pararhodobacter oceanensis]|uniref:3-methylcrotonyl-CoA carboxylase n=1 Tax=Pararhodobacter oceanensis TaxID=2172121 RepID=A0A2T8HXB7_9RHOB|nr:acetyl/propionyl/methylcrotonyl-CoA carboxylase subunit alpha [Pararhodobacter oceanensis]PVH30071.1 3-methylcrotonyl-CoA carboxylase [Pararhodobacter oceanensis]
MFRKILIANRGEIACRVILSAQAMGVRTVAVYSDADADARHVALADEAVHIGGPRPADSYLKGARIIEAALATGAQAIHPGFGFLSENPDFVDAVTKAGLVFIGPSAEAIRAMGLKDAAKALMEKAGVPVVPGYQGENQETAHLARAAQDIGYPVLIKAVAGGGGKGMRLVEDPKDFAEALASAQGEAATAFGNANVLIEKYIQRPRHIEVQVFGDGTKAVHLFERDCSLQRRHQKVIEEAPAPGMTEEMRAAMGQAAVRAAEAIGYAGAGTVEFIVDGSEGLRTDGFWFMEMNTRLQVEHPVTEAITGVDLVEWQLRVAAGEALPARQEDLSITGHAFEARLYAEDVPAGFLPATGTLHHLAFPEFARIDSGVRQGDTISPWYDPMIAKVVTYGPTRSVALARLEAALAATQVAGSVTNLDFLGALTRHEGFARGEVDTGLIARDYDALTAQPEVPMASVALAALAAVPAAGAGEAGSDAGFTLWAPLSQSVALEHGETLYDCRVARSDKGWDVRVNDTDMEAEWRAGAWWIDGARAQGEALQVGAGISVFGAVTVHFTRPDPLAVEAGAGASAGLVLAPMPGLVKAVFVQAGEHVEKGARLAVLEAMKMEHTLTAGRDGTVEDVLAKAGDQVEAGAALITLADE